MKSEKILLALVPLFLMGQIGLALAEGKSNSVESATWRVEFDNDVFFNNIDISALSGAL